MEYEENSANLTTRAASKKLHNIDYGTKSLKQITKSMMLKNMSENQGDTICNVEMDVDKLDNELQNGIPDDAQALKLEDTINKILEYLDETINVLQVVDIGLTGALALDCDSDCSCFEHQNVTNNYFHVENQNDDMTVTENHRNESNSDNEAEICNFNVTVTKNRDKNYNEWNEFFGAIILVLIFFSLYFLLSCVM